MLAHRYQLIKLKELTNWGNGIVSVVFNSKRRPSGVPDNSTLQANKNK